ncbi:hypothetical protein [Amycolatopsis oliviviridis]
MDLSIQLGQIAAGKRAELDGKSLLGTFVGGALGGAFAGIFHAGAVWLRGVALEGAGQAAGRVAAEAAEDVVAKVAAKEAADAVDDAVPGGVTGKTGGEKAPEATAGGEKAVESPKRVIPGSVEALGHLSYGAGQVGVVFITAPVINAATGSPHASPWLGMLGALSGFGGGRNGSSGSGAGSLDAVMTALDHLPSAPRLKIPAADIKTDGLTTGERLFLEPPPSYADTIDRQSEASPITTVLEESPATAVAPIAGERTSISAPLPLAPGVGIAFVDPAYLGNVTKAFAGHAPGVLPIAVHHRDGSVILPDSSGRPVPRDYGRFTGELAGLAPWGEISKIELYACDVTPENVAGLNTALRTVPALAHITLTPHRVNERVHILPDGSDRSGDVPDLPPGTLTLAPGTPPPLDGLTWRPPLSAAAGPQDLNGYIRQRGIVSPRNFDAVLSNGGLPPELWTAVRDEVVADTGPPPVSWVRSWAEGMESASGALGLHYRPSDVARASGALLNEHEIAQTWGRARVTFESALDVRGGLDQADSLAVRSMIEGFVDAAVQARPNALPQVQAGVFVGPDSTTGLTELGRLIEWSVRSRLGEYPADVVTPSADVLLTRVAVSALTRPVADGRIGVVQIRVDGQRGLSGLYGPKAYASPQNLLPAELSAELAGARAALPTVGDAPALAEARAIMNRYHQPPRVFVEREPSRLHQAHGERHEAATLLVAWELFNYFDQVAAESRARQLIDFVGWPRQSGILGGSVSIPEPATAEAGPSSAEPALVAANMYGEENLIALLPDDVDPAVPRTAWRNSSVHSMRYILRESGHGDTDPSRPAETAELARWARVTGDRRPTPLVLALWQGDSGFRVGRENLDPAETVRYLQKSAVFQRFQSDSPRPPLVLLMDGGDGELTAEFLGALSARMGPVHSFLYQGPSHFEPEGTIRVPREAEFTETFGVRLDDVQYVNEGVAFSFFETGYQTEVDGAGEVAAAAIMEWGATHDGPFPTVVVLPGDDTMVPIGLRGDDVRVPAGGEDIARLYLEEEGTREELAADPDWPILLVADFPHGEARPGDVRFDFSAALAREGFFNPVYATTRHAPEAGRVFPLVSGLYADRVELDFVAQPDEEPTVVFVRHEGDDAALDAVRSWGEHEDAAGVRSVEGPDGEDVPVPWSNAVPIFVKPDADGRVHLVRSDGRPATGGLGAALRDSGRVRSALGSFADGRAPHLEWTPLLVPLEGRITGLGEFARVLADGGYSRAIYAARGPVVLNDDGTITLTEAGFDHVPAVPPDLARVVSFPLANARLGVHGQFFPRDATDMLVQWRVGASTGPVSGQLYFSETSETAGPLYFDTFLAPGGEPSWRTVVHGGPGWIEVALSTGRPFELGDRFALEGDAAGATLFGSAVYRMAQPDPHRPYWMLACESAANTKLTRAIESRWGTGPVLGLTDTANFRWTGDAVHVNNGGHLTAVNRPHLRNPDLGQLAAGHIGPQRIERRDGSDLGSDVLELSRRAARASAWRLANGGEPAAIRIAVRGGAEADGLAWGERLAADLRAAADEEAASLTSHYRLPDVRERSPETVVAFEDGGQRPMVADVEVILSEGDFGADALNPRYLDGMETAFAALTPAARGVPGPVAVLELPRGLGVAFVDPAHTGNVTKAFAAHEEGVLPVAVHHREGRWVLPEGRATSRQFADALVALPASRVTWPEITRLRLYACYLTPGIVTGLQAAMREIPALEHVTVSAAHSGVRVHFLPDGDIVTGAVRDLPKGTLTLARGDENAGSGGTSRRSARQAAASLLTGVREALSTVTHRPRRKGKEAAESSRPATPREVPGSPAADDGSLYVRPRTPDRHSRENEPPPLDVVSFRPPLAEQPGPKTWYDYVLRRGIAGEGKLAEVVEGLAEDLGAGLTRVRPLPTELWELVRDQVELDPIPAGWVRPWAEAMNTRLDRNLPWDDEDDVVNASAHLLDDAEVSQAWGGARVAYELSDHGGGRADWKHIERMLNGFVDAAVQARPDALPRVTASISQDYGGYYGPSRLRSAVEKAITSRLAEYPPGAVMVSAEQLLARVSLSVGPRDNKNRGMVRVRVDGQRALSGLYGPVAYSDADNPLGEHQRRLTVNWKTLKESRALATSVLRGLAPDDPVFSEARDIINRTQEPPREDGARHPLRVHRAHRSRYAVAVDIVAWQLAMARADVTRAGWFRENAWRFAVGMRSYLAWPRQSVFSGGVRVLPAPSPAGGEVAVLALPYRTGVAFVDPGYAVNVAQAFTDRNIVVREVPVVVHHRNGQFELPRRGRGPVPHDSTQFAEVLAKLPGGVVYWPDATDIHLYACDLTPEIVGDLEAAVKAVPALNHLTVSAPKQGSALHLRTDGTFDQGDRAVQPPGTLTLARASGSKPSRSARAALSSFSTGLRQALTRRPGRDRTAAAESWPRWPDEIPPFTRPQDEVVPSDVLAFRPPRDLRARPSTLYEYVLQRGLAGEGRVGALMDSYLADGIESPLPAELWTMVADEVRRDPIPVHWVRSWAEKYPVTSTRTAAEDSGLLLNETEVELGWGVARTGHATWLTRAFDLSPIPRMLAGFVDAAVQAPPDDLPRVAGRVFVDAGSSWEVAELRALVRSSIESRLAAYPPGSVTVSVERLLGRLAITAVTRPQGDPLIGVVQVRVDGQRSLSGLYGPGAYFDPDNPSHRHARYSVEHEERVRAELARLRPDDPVFTEARGLMDRLYEPPRDFAGQEPPLLHRLHRKRYQVVLERIAMQLARAQRLTPRQHYVAMSRQHLHEYVDFVGWPRMSAILGGARAMFAPSGAGGEVAALPLRHNAGIAFVEPRYATNVALTFARHPRDTMPVAVHHRQGRWVLPDAGGTPVPHDHGQFAAVLANLPAGLISWGGISWIDLLACDLRDEDVAGLNDALRAVPALSHITATAVWAGTRIHLVSDGRALRGEHADLPPGTLTLTPADSSGTSSSDAGTPPAGVLAWRPGGPDRTLNDLTRRLSIANETNFSRFMQPGRFGSLAPELWRLIQEQVAADASPTPRSWARSWIETMDSVRSPEGDVYRSEDLAAASGILNAWEVDQARGRAREAFEGRLGDDGELDRDSVASIELMVDGFVDAAVRANPDALPMIQAVVFAEQGSTGGTTLVRSLVEAQIRFRLSQYPADALRTPMERLLSRVSFSLRTPQAGDERIGKVEVRVDGQREVSGLYGPAAFSDPDDPLPLHRDELEEARRDLADVDRNGPVFLDARRIMNRFHQPPRVFAGEEPRIHQAHRERHQAATDLVAWDLTKPPHRYIDDNVRLARQRAQALLGPVGWPR